MILSARRRVDGAGVYPTVHDGIVSAASIKEHEGVRLTASTPDDHLLPCPYCCVTRSGAGRTCHASRVPDVGDRIVSSASVLVRKNTVSATPDDHFAACPYCTLSVPARGCVIRSYSCPAIGARIVFSASVQKLEVVTFSAPDNHLASSPDGSVPVSFGRDITNANSPPGI